MNFDTLKLGDSFEMVVEDTEGSYIVVIMTPTIGYMFFPKVVDVVSTLRTVMVAEDDKFAVIMSKMKGACEEVNATVTFLPISQTLVDHFQETFAIDLLEYTTIPEPIVEEEVAYA